MVRSCRYFSRRPSGTAEISRLRSFLIVVESPIGVERRKSEVGGWWASFTCLTPSQGA